MNTNPFIRSLIVAAATFQVLIPVSVNAQSDGFEGRWAVVSVPAGWAKVPGTTVLVSPGVAKICVGRVPTTSLKYSVDHRSGTVDATRREKGRTVVQQGVFRRDGNTLTLSVGAEGKPRPSSPDQTDKGAMRWVLRKVS
jgi:hypothetical protein